MRRMVSDDQDVFRVVVVKKKQIQNPDYRPEDYPRTPRWIFTDETFETAYGPYNSEPTAKGIRTRETWDWYEKKLRPGVVSSRIEKAVTKWETVA